MTGIRVYVGELIAPRRRSASSRAANGAATAPSTSVRPADALIA
jgi:hypothetical protein